jgi:4,5:9,10-diseco-3-hydroxy-5,9,17-trioxoandrosta-1(10),2-diene-4-oate hydrolase
VIWNRGVQKRVAQNGPESGLIVWSDSSRVPMHVSVAGSGSPIVLLHGLLGGSFCWRFNLTEFTSVRTAYAIDMAGMGTSVAPRKTDCGMCAQAERIASFIESRDLHDIDLIGSSWGGGVAMLLAAGSSRIRSLVLAAPVNPWSDFGRERVRFFGGRFGSVLVHCGLPFARRLHETGVQRMYGDIARIRPGTLEGYSALLRRRGRAGNLINILRSWERDVDALRPAIPRIKAPTLLIWGSRDGAVDPGSAKALEKALPQARTAVLPGVGHLPFEESPEVFNRLVLDFIEHPA